MAETRFESFLLCSPTQCQPTTTALELEIQAHNASLLISLHTARHELLDAVTNGTATYAIAVATDGFSAARSLFQTVSIRPSLLSLSRPSYASLSKSEIFSAIADKQAVLEDMCVLQAEKMMQGPLVWDVALMHAMAWGDMEAEIEVRRELEMREVGKPRSMAEDWAWVNEGVEVVEHGVVMYARNGDFAGKKVRKAAPPPIKVFGSQAAFMPGCRAVHVVCTGTPEANDDEVSEGQGKSCIWQELVDDLELEEEDAEALVELLLSDADGDAEKLVDPFLTDEDDDYMESPSDLLLSDSEAEEADDEKENGEENENSDEEMDAPMVDINLEDVFSVQPALRWMLQGDGRSEDAIMLVSDNPEALFFSEDDDEAYQADSESVC